MSDEYSERCKCTLRESLLGEGCKMCKPYLHIEKLESTLENAEGEITNLEIRITQLEEELAKVTARYNCVRDMTPEDFGNLSSINDDFDSQVDELIKDRIAKYPITRGDDLSIESAREIARTALASQAQQTAQEPVAWMNPHGGLLHVRETGLEMATFTIPLYLQSQAQQPTDLSKQLREYAADSGYSHNDYADTMLAGASEIERCAAILTASQAQQEPVSQWQPIATAPKNKKIIVRYKNALGKDRTVFAKYLDKFTEEASKGTDCETDYCEDDDTFYCKEGWVELIDNWDDFSSVYFDSRNVPTHWMPLPPAPEGGDKS